MKKLSGNYLQILLWLVLGLGLVVFVLPYIFMISNSFEKFSYSLPYPPHILPSRFNLDAYLYVFNEKHVLTPFLNSVFITSVTAALSIAVSSLSAYGFACINFKGREPLFKVYLLTLMIPGFLNIIPQYLVLAHINFLPGMSQGLVGTRLGLITLYVGTGICGNTFFLRGFFQSLPKEISESVVMDGGTHWTIYSRILLPLSKPAIGTLTIFTVQGLWEEFFTAKIVLGSNSQKILTLPIVLQQLNGEHATRYEWVFAFSILMQIPIILIYILFQKKFVVGGLSEGAVKG